MAMRKRIAIFHFIGNYNSADHFGKIQVIKKIACILIV